MKPGTETYLYGAEDLEARYTRSVLLAFSIAAVMVLAVFLYPYLQERWRKPSEDKIPVKATRVINYSELQAPPPIDLERRIPEPLETPPQAKTVKYLQPVVKKDEEVPDDQQMPTREELSSALIGTQNIEGTDSIYVEQPEVQVQPASVEEVKEEEVFNFVEVMPEYPGGREAFYAYLSGAIRYPPIARESEIQGTVFIAFVIGRDGRITNVEVARGVHPLLDEEAVRVIAAMPNWIPAMQNQQPVSVRYTIPVAFVLRY